MPFGIKSFSGTYEHITVTVSLFYDAVFPNLSKRHTEDLKRMKCTRQEQPNLDVIIPTQRYGRKGIQDPSIITFTTTKIESRNIGIEVVKTRSQLVLNHASRGNDVSGHKRGYKKGFVLFPKPSCPLKGRGDSFQFTFRPNPFSLLKTTRQKEHKEKAHHCKATEVSVLTTEWRTLMVSRCLCVINYILSSFASIPISVLMLTLHLCLNGLWEIRSNHATRDSRQSWTKNRSKS